MVVRARKKGKKLRGSRTHGHGAGKKHRGAGSRGGRGRAGSGKRGAQKKTYYHAKKLKVIGKRGIQGKHPRKTEIKSITLKVLERSLDKWLDSKIIKKEKDTYVVELKKAGFDKIIGTSKLKSKIKVSCKSATEKAKNIIEKAGGTIELQK